MDEELDALYRRRVGERRVRVGGALPIEHSTLSCDEWNTREHEQHGAEGGTDEQETIHGVDARHVACVHIEKQQAKHQSQEGQEQQPSDCQAHTLSGHPSTVRPHPHNAQFNPTFRHAACI